MSRRRSWMWWLFAALALAAALAAAVAVLNRRGEAPITDAHRPPQPSSPAQIERGRYLALAGNCAGCHTVRGGAAFAGGRGIETPFGTIFAGNLTPDPGTGLGSWSADQFWRAMHNGRSRDGRLLYPAFPYTSFTQITREDSDALYAWLRTLPPVVQANQPHALRFPYNTQAALAVWRALNFSPAGFEPAPQKTAEWNRGAYLVNGLGHCIACHGTRNTLGATDTQRGLAGGMLPGEAWYAPALDAKAEAGVGGWTTKDVVELLKTGRNAHASVTGPMGDVVSRSTQHLSKEDLGAMATYLRALPPRAEQEARAEAASAPASARVRRGEKIYAQECAWCHGERGEGVAEVFPALAGNRAVGLANPANLIQMVRRGGYPPATEGNPRPYGMPPFGHVLDDEEIAAVLTYIRASWGNAASEVTLRDTMRR
ncbi:c-type cytochrome [Variovorax sp. JS1663]|uniref:c-type cytochrome n=1 Tax=Variovorax sp. JS1663 TaxID=1851577 RepID=UPI000B344DDD|nr:cytochrome c [Variovorax sp. JS1663]OUM01395.1 alcohol dehydrogenase [Variovorax sp. JS1663]